MKSKLRGNYKLIEPTILGNCTWDEFGHWGLCSLSCGGGVQSRTRGIKQREAYGGEQCNGNATETRECNVAACKGTLRTPCLLRWCCYFQFHNLYLPHFNSTEFFLSQG